MSSSEDRKQKTEYRSGKTENGKFFSLSSVFRHLLSVVRTPSSGWGFTLVELIVVFGIVAGLFSTGVYVSTTSSLNKARDATRIRDLEQLKNAAEIYYQDNNCYPATIPASGTWSAGSGGVYMQKIPKDPETGNPYAYKTDTIACPQWMILFAKFSKPQTSFQACPVPSYVTSNTLCVPSEFDTSTGWGCVVSGNVTCGAPIPTPTIAGVPTNTPTPTTPAGGAPIVDTNAASGVTVNTATLIATINANGAVTNYWWKYGATSAPDCLSLAGSTTTTGTLASGSSSPTIDISGLTVSTPYYFCAVGQNSAGTTYGIVLSFTTLVPTPTPTPVPCQVTTSPAAVNFILGGPTQTVSASVTSGLGGATVTQMRFGSYNTSIATVSPASDSSSPYQTSVTPVAAGTSAVWGTADLSDGRACQSSGTTDTDVNVSVPTPTPTPTRTPTPTPTPTPTCTSGYQDQDGDLYGAGAFGCYSGTVVASNTDCYDLNANARPEQTIYFTTNRGDGSFDYNCDGLNNQQYICCGSSVSICNNCTSGCSAGCGSPLPNYSGLAPYSCHSVFLLQACR